jgi:phosphoglycolate phosphatase
MAIKGILFDKDGTLLDYFETWTPVNQEVALAVAEGDEALAERLLVAIGRDREMNLALPGSILAAGTARDFAACWVAQLEGRGEEELAAQIDAIFVDGGRRHAVAVEGMERVIPALKLRGFALGIATSDSAAGAEASLGHFDVLRHFDFVAGCDSGHGTKPGPGQVHGFCAATGLAAPQVAVVGDNTHDLEMGRAAGAGLVVGVLTGTGRHEDLAVQADHVLESIVELEALLG